MKRLIFQQKGVFAKSVRKAFCKLIGPIDGSIPFPGCIFHCVMTSNYLFFATVKRDFISVSGFVVDRKGNVEHFPKDCWIFFFIECLITLCISNLHFLSIILLGNRRKLLCSKFGPFSHEIFLASISRGENR